LAALFAVLSAAIVTVGVPSPGVSTGERASRPFIARTRFTVIDPVATYQRRQQARDRALSVYTERAGWRGDLLLTFRAVTQAVLESSNFDEAQGRLAAEAIEVDSRPLWDAIHSPDGLDPEYVVREVEKIADDLRRTGVIEDERMEAEIGSGRRGIIRPDRTRGVREAALAAPGQPGVLDVAAAREKVAAALRVSLPGRPALVEALAGVLRRDLGPSLEFHRERTRSTRDAAAQAVPEVEIAVSPGEVIVRKGDRIGPTEYQKIIREAEAYHSRQPLRSHALRLSGVVTVVGLTVLMFGWAVRRLDPSSLGTPRAVFFVGVMDILVVAAARALVVTGFPAALAPVTLATMLLALAVSPLLAVLNAAALAVIVTFAVGMDFSIPLALSTGAVVGSLYAARARRRAELVRAGALAGIAQFAATIGVKAGLGAEDLPVLLEAGGWAMMNGLVCGLFSLGLLPLVEAAFGLTTDISLLELSDQNQPALRRLLLEAPGTYHHSLIVGNLAEAAALAVGCNALLARVASYYHDIGKIERPEYFIENEPPGRGRHEGLSPSMSTLIITSHVRDGVVLGLEYRLPRAILDTIAQHHGTSLVEFFYRAAVERANGAPVDERPFRYPGPKPQTRETAIVLIADSVEAASRTLTDPTPARLSKMVRDIAMKRLLDGQFDESGLTLRDIRTTHDSFVKVLSSMFHSRVPYPSAAEHAGPPADGRPR
jgi:putative nucleotidyltransferase with HDIG domain